MENNYYLAVETKPNNFFPINLKDLSIFRQDNTTNLEKIDSFTLKFTKMDLISAIKEANLLNITENMPLVIIYHEKDNTRKINVLTKDIEFDMWSNLKNNYSDKNYVNKVYNFLQSKISSSLADNIKNSNSEKEFITNISTLPYTVQRKLYFYLYEN